MKHLKYIILTLLITLSPSISISATQTINTLPSAGSSFLSDVTSFMANEDANRFIQYLTPQVSSGGTASTDASLTHTISAVTGFPNGYYTNQAATSHTYTASKDTFVYLRDDDTRILVIGGAAITYDSYLAFAEMANGTSQPTTPIGFLLLLEAVTDGTGITTVNDLRSLFMLIAEGYQPNLGDVLQINASSEVTGSSTVDNLSANTVYAKHKIQVGVGTSAVTLFVTGYIPTAGDILVIDAEGRAVTGYQILYVPDTSQIGTGDSAVTVFAAGVSPYNNAYLQLTKNASGVTFTDGPPRPNQFFNPSFSIMTSADGVYPQIVSSASGYISASGTSITLINNFGNFSIGDHIVIGHASDGTSGIDEITAGVSVFEINATALDGDGVRFTVEGDAFVTTTVSSVTDIVHAMPGKTASDNDAFDGWHVSGDTVVDVNLYRSPISGVSQGGQGYPLYFVTETDAISVLIAGPVSTLLGNGIRGLAWQNKIANQTMTIGVYVKAYSTSTVRVALYEETADIVSVPTIVSDYHSGGGEWEWLEVSGTFGERGNTKYMSAQIRFEGTGVTGYIQRPCWVFGTSIGEGNCVNQLGETIRFEADVILTNFDFGVGDIAADLDQELINIETLSKLKIPDNISEIYVSLKGRDSATAGDIGAWLGPDTTYAAQDIGDVGIFLQGVGNDAPLVSNGWVRVSRTTGNPWLFLNMSGANTGDLEIRIQGVRLK